jgi:hypothetical protein
MRNEEVSSDAIAKFAKVNNSWQQRRMAELFEDSKREERLQTEVVGKVFHYLFVFPTTVL